MGVWRYLLYWYIFTCTISLALVTGGPGRRQLEKFQDQNDVPMEVYLGLLSNKTNVETISFVNDTFLIMI